MGYQVVDVYLKFPRKQPVLLGRNIRELLLGDVPTTNTCVAVILRI